MPVATAPQSAASRGVSSASQSPDESVAASAESQSTVLLVERDRLVGEFAARYLRTTGGFGSTMLADNVEDAVAMARRHRPDVLVLSWSAGQADFATIDRRLRDESPSSALVLFADILDYTSVTHAVNAGYAGVVCRRTGRPEQLLVAVRAAAHGMSHFSHEVLSVLSDPPPQPARVTAVLSTRERQVLELLLASKSTSEIAEDLYISQHTVRNHVRHILTKLQARTKLEAVVRAVQAGLVSLDPVA